MLCPASCLPPLSTQAIHQASLFASLSPGNLLDHARPYPKPLDAVSLSLQYIIKPPGGAQGGSSASAFARHRDSDWCSGTGVDYQPYISGKPRQPCLKLRAAQVGAQSFGCWLMAPRAAGAGVLEMYPGEGCIALPGASPSLERRLSRSPCCIQSGAPWTTCPLPMAAW